MKAAFTSGQEQAIERLIRHDILEAEEYSPILPTDVLSENMGIPVGSIIKLDGNENPYGCSPRVQRSLHAQSNYHIYPDPQQRELRSALARYVNIGSD